MSREKRTSPQPGTVTEVAHELESDIIFGRIRPNKEILEDSLMARFNAKRHVVRTALSQLVAKGIVVKEFGRSARVKDFTVNEVEEIYAMRALLQGHAARTMPLPVSAHHLEALKKIHIKYVTAVSLRCTELTIHELNDEFHDYLFGLCGNRLLSEAIIQYTELSNPIRSYGIVDGAWLDRAITEHQAMIVAIEEGNRDKLEALVVEHMQPTRSRWQEMRARDEHGATPVESDHNGRH